MPFVNAAYYASWEVYNDKPPSSLSAKHITHVFYAFIGVNQDGTLRRIDDWADSHKETDQVAGGLAAMTKLKRQNPHLKILVSFGGGSGSVEFPALAADAEGRGTFAKQVRALLDQHGFDGVDIDWEHPTTKLEGRHYIELLQALRRTLPKHSYMITSALPSGEYCLRNIDLQLAAEELDFISLMGYDFTGPWTSVSGHHAQLHSTSPHPTLGACVSHAVSYLLSQGFPRDKVVLGVPVYARFFAGAARPGDSFETAGEVKYCDLPEQWIREASVDKNSVAASYVDRGGRGFVSFDVVRTVTQKGAYVRNLGLGGLFYWHGTGDREGEDSLIAAGFEALRALADR